VLLALPLGSLVTASSLSLLNKDNVVDLSLFDRLALSEENSVTLYDKISIIRGNLYHPL